MSGYLHPLSIPSRNNSLDGSPYSATSWSCSSPPSRSASGDAQHFLNIPGLPPLHIKDADNLDRLAIAAAATATNTSSAPSTSSASPSQGQFEALGTCYVVRCAYGFTSRQIFFIRYHAIVDFVRYEQILSHTETWNSLLRTLPLPPQFIGYSSHHHHQSPLFRGARPRPCHAYICILDAHVNALISHILLSPSCKALRIRVKMSVRCTCDERAQSLGTPVSPSASPMGRSRVVMSKAGRIRQASRLLFIWRVKIDQTLKMERTPEEEIDIEEYWILLGKEDGEFEPCCSQSQWVWGANCGRNVMRTRLRS